MRVIWKRRICVGPGYPNLPGVEGMGGTSAQRRLGLGATSYSVRPNPGPPDVQPVTVNFTLRGGGFQLNPSVQANPDPPDDQALPVSIQLIFDATGALTEVGATLGVIER